MHARGEPDDYQARAHVPERRHRPAEIARIRSENLIQKLREPRAPSAVDVVRGGRDRGMIGFAAVQSTHVEWRVASPPYDHCGSLRITAELPERAPE
jgi:hypothetical protein